MSTSWTRSLAVVAALALMVTGAVWAQQPISARLQPTGLIEVTAGEAPLATIELNAHGPGWQHAPQATAVASFSALPDGAGQRFVGSLPVPNTEGGSIQYTETVTPLPQGLKLAWDLTMPQTMRLNGLQVSVNLPVARYGNAEVMISQPHGEAQVAGLPAEQQEGRVQVWSGQGSLIEAAKGTPDAITLELRAATDVVIQDLRQWESEVFEIRFPAIMEDAGREVSAGDRFHLDLIVSFAGPVTIEAPGA